MKMFCLLAGLAVLAVVNADLKTNKHSDGEKGPTVGQYPAVHPGAYPVYPFGFYPVFYPFSYPFAYPGAYPAYPSPHGQKSTHFTPASFSHGPTALFFRGRFDGTCDHKYDGLYYVDQRSFAYCSGGRKTLQACAEGSENPDFTEFKSGKYQHFYDFCSINLTAKDFVNPSKEIPNEY